METDPPPVALPGLVGVLLELGALLVPLGVGVLLLTAAADDD
jgi:hypothetical protein